MSHDSTELQINLPIGNVNGDPNGFNGDPNGFNGDPNGFNGHSNYHENMAFANGICMANRDPIDLQFKDVTYTVNLGFNKGMLIIIICLVQVLVSVSVLFSCSRNFLWQILPIKWNLFPILTFMMVDDSFIFIIELIWPLQHEMHGIQQVLLELHLREREKGRAKEKKTAKFWLESQYYLWTMYYNRFFYYYCIILLSDFPLWISLYLFYVHVNKIIINALTSISNGI